jgi:hypothetical protein
MKRLWRFGWLVLALVVAGCADPYRDTVTYESAYHRPLMSPGAEFGNLPAAVQNTIRAQTGSAVIRHIETNYISGDVVYDVYFANSEIYPPLYIAKDGSVLNPDFSIAVAAPPVVATNSNSVALSELPASVLSALRESAAGGTISTLEKEMWGSRVVYIIGFKDAVHYPKLFVTNDGTVLKEAHR